MKPIFAIDIMGDPVGKQRPQLDRRHNRLYTPTKTERWEKAAAKHMALLWRFLPLDRPVEVRVYARHKRPKGCPSRVSAEVWAGDGRPWRPSAPDVDNIAKIAMDAAVRAKVLKDDTIVVRLIAETTYAAPGEAPHTRLEIYPIAEEAPTGTRDLFEDTPS